MKKDKKTLHNELVFWLFVFLPAAINLLAHLGAVRLNNKVYVFIGMVLLVLIIGVLVYVTLTRDFKMKKIILGFNILAGAYLPLVYLAADNRVLLTVSLGLRILITAVVVILLIPKRNKNSDLLSEPTEDEDVQE